MASACMTASGISACSARPVAGTRAIAGRHAVLKHAMPLSKRATPRTPARLPSPQAAAAPAEVTEMMSVPELKMALLDSFWGTERGLNASSDARAEIVELITQLEANNPTPLPNETQELLDGTWKLVYTSNSEVLALLGLSRLPFVEVGDITQTVDGSKMTVENKVQLSGPLVRTSFATSASVEVRSPKLLQVQFQEGRVATPELLQDVELPASLELAGQQVDLKPLQSVLQPLEGPLRGVLSQLGSVLSRQPDLQFPIRSPRASTWLLNTYLDKDLRITRGDGGSVYVLVKDAVGAGEEWVPPVATAAADPVAAEPAAPVVEPTAVIEEDIVG